MPPTKQPVNKLLNLPSSSMSSNEFTALFLWLKQLKPKLSQTVWAHPAIWRGYFTVCSTFLGGKAEIKTKYSRVIFWHTWLELLMKDISNGSIKKEKIDRFMGIFRLHRSLTWKSKVDPVFSSCDPFSSCPAKTSQWDALNYSWSIVEE